MKTIKVLAFDARLPRDGLHNADAQIGGAHRYYNRLIEIEREYLADKAALRRQCLSARGRWGKLKAKALARSCGRRLRE